MSKRKILESIYGHRYSHIITHNIADKNFCLYCGDYMQCIDHQPPISLVESISHLNGAVEYVLVPACNECNGLLSDKMTNTVDERFKLAKRLLNKKYQSMLIATAEERDSSYLTGNLKRQCKAYDQAGVIVRSRIAFKGYGFSLNGKEAEVDSATYIIDGEKFDDKYTALAFVCKREGIKYKKVLATVPTGKLSIEEIVREFRRLQWVEVLKVFIKDECKDRWKKMPKKIIESHLQNASSLTTKDILVEKLDLAYAGYLDRMGMKP